MNNMDEDIYVKREKNITVEGSKVSPLGGDLEGAFHLTSLHRCLCVPGKSYLPCVRLFLDITAKSLNKLLYIFTVGNFEI